LLRESGGSRQLFGRIPNGSRALDILVGLQKEIPQSGQAVALA
jgi:hypothetical protein